MAAVSFFGTGFTIMAFHNDISINKIFSHVYELVMGYPSDGYSILEVSYSIGLAAGIILFFNHIGGRRITKDPTPIEVEMRVYETDVNKALIETAESRACKTAFPGNVRAELWSFGIGGGLYCAGFRWADSQVCR